MSRNNVSPRNKRHSKWVVRPQQRSSKPNWSLKANRVPLIILSERLLASIVSSLTEPKFHLATFLLKFRYFYNQQRRSYCIQLSNLTSEIVITLLLAELRVLQKIVKLSFCLKMICPNATNDIISYSQSNCPQVLLKYVWEKLFWTATEIKSFLLKINCENLLGVARNPPPPVCRSFLDDKRVILLL